MINIDISFLKAKTIGRLLSVSKCCNTLENGKNNGGEPVTIRTQRWRFDLFRRYIIIFGVEKLTVIKYYGIMTADEFKEIGRPPTYNKRSPAWKKAFEEYNSDHPKDRPLHLGCMSCYIKVYKYLKAKYAN